MIEMLVVLIVVGVLAAVAVPQYLRKTEITRWSEAVSIARSMSSAESRYCFTGTACASVIGNLDVEVPTMRYFDVPTLTGACACALGVVSGRTYTFTRNSTDNYGSTSGNTIVYGVNASGTGVCVNSGSTAPAWVRDNIGSPSC